MEEEIIEEFVEEEITERQHPFTVISILGDENNWHDIQQNSSWSANPYGESYAIVPDGMVDEVLACGCWCNIEVENGVLTKITKVEPPTIEEPIPEMTTADVVQMMAQRLLDAKPTADKIGYKLELVYSSSGSFVWEYVPDENYTPSHSGDYIDPIPYVEGMTVMTGNFYTDGSDIWEALKNGTPVDFTDRDYFDIIG